MSVHSKNKDKYIISSLFNFLAIMILFLLKNWLFK